MTNYLAIISLFSTVCLVVYAFVHFLGWLGLLVLLLLIAAWLVVPFFWSIHKRVKEETEKDKARRERIKLFQEYDQDLIAELSEEEKVAQQAKNAAIAELERVWREGENNPSLILQKFRRPTIFLRRENGAQSSKSHFGGVPSLPANLAWPCHRSTGLPLHFLAQVDLSELPSTPLSPGGPQLPNQGMLFFFADLDEEMLWDADDPTDCTRVLYSRAAGGPSEVPANLPHIGHSFGEHTASGAFSGAITRGETPCSVFPEKSITPVMADSFEGQEAYGGGLHDLAAKETIISIERGLKTKVPKFDELGDLRLAALGQHSASDKFRIARHQMLGAAVNVQGAAHIAYASGRVSLLQIDSDPGIHEDFSFCDAGMVQFWIDPADLALEKFERAFATTEGG